MLPDHAFMMVVAVFALGVMLFMASVMSSVLEELRVLNDHFDGVEKDLEE